MSNFNLTSEEINRILMSSPYALPDSPATSGLGAGQIRKYFYSFITVLAKMLNLHLDEVAAAVSDLGGELEGTAAQSRDELGAHNASADAHGDIRDLVTSHKTSSGAHGDIRALVPSHNESTIAHLDMRASISEAQKTAEGAKGKAESALSNVAEVRKVVPVTTFYDSFTDVVRHCLYVDDLKSGDIFINTTNNTVDFIVCRMNTVSNGEEFTVITEEMLNNNALPIPEAGDKYKFSINGVARAVGIIGIEGGINTPVVIGSEEYTLVESITLSEEQTVSRRYDKRFKKILIVATDSASTLPRFNVMGKAETGVEWTNTVYSPIKTHRIMVIEGEILVPGSASRVRAYSGGVGDIPTESFTNTGNFIRGNHYDGFETVSSCAAGTTITVYGVEYED